MADRKVCDGCGKEIKSGGGYLSFTHNPGTTLIGVDELDDEGAASARALAQVMNQPTFDFHDADCLAPWAKKVTADHKAALKALKDEQRPDETH